MYEKTGCNNNKHHEDDVRSDLDLPGQAPDSGTSNHLYELNSYVFDLPQELIAQYPSSRRGDSRMLKVGKSSGRLVDGMFADLQDHLRPGDTLVLNRTKVMPARLFGTKESGGRIELLLLEEDPGSRQIWTALVRPAKRLKKGHRIVFPDCGGITARVEDELPEPGMRRIAFEGGESVYDLMDRAGHMPLPPYINRNDEELDRERYQTVFAAVRGSVAAPTAGLHFTDEILEQLHRSGINIQHILLHVGLGTFRPVSSQDIRDHHMHAEYYEISQSASDNLNQAREAGGRIIAVGSTVSRTLESSCTEEGLFVSGRGKTDRFIYPGYRFRAVDGLLTNFHLPGSSLIMMVAAFAGYDLTMKAYRHAVEQRYRFFSYGDAMLILPDS